MKRMYDEKELQELIAKSVEKATSLDEIMKNAVDITGLPREAEMVSPYKEVIEKALKSKCVKLNSYYFFVGVTFIDSNTKEIVEWDSFNETQNLGAQLSVNISYIEQKLHYKIAFGEV